MPVLENDRLKVTVSDHGAELCSVVDKATGCERIWCADPAVWNRHAPILFPFVGKVTEGKYRIGGREYRMKTQHGFARDMDFRRVKETASSVTHRLAATDATKEIYPYDFRLQVKHFLDPDHAELLHIEWDIENAGDTAMTYAIGGHPGFQMPAGVKKEDCFLVFPGKERLAYFQVNKEGFALPHQVRELTLENGCSPYLENIPDTWIFSEQEIGTAGISLPDGKPFVTLHCEGFPLIAVWANPKGTFICLEPWYGRTDDAGFTGSLEEKPGMQQLLPGEKKKIAYSIEFHS